MGRTAQGSEALQPKAVYEPVAKLEAFYTGGAVRVTRDNKHMACACGDEVKVRVQCGSCLWFVLARPFSVYTLGVCALGDVCATFGVG
jgi:hypothetical protein